MTPLVTTDPTVGLGVLIALATLLMLAGIVRLALTHARRLAR